MSTLSPAAPTVQSVPSVLSPSTPPTAHRPPATAHRPPPSEKPPLGLILLAPITNYSDHLQDRPQPIIATLAESRRQGLTWAAQKAMQHPGQAFALFECVDALIAPTPPAADTPPKTANSEPKTSRSTRRLLGALKDYLGAPPTDSTAKQHDLAMALIQTLL